MLGAASILTVVYVVSLRSSEGNWTWLEDPVHWTLMALIFVITVVRDWTTRLVAGSDWLRVNRRWVDTYALTDITLRGVVFGWMLRLRDNEGRRVRTSMTTIEANRQLWALAYTGMAHSVHHGARINNLAAGMLRLRPGLESLRREVYRPTVPTKSAGTLLLVIAAVFAAISLFRPELLGPALAVLAAAVLLVGAGIGTVLVMARRREDALDAQTFDTPDHHE
ncbi:hypothetical protein FHX42_002675 [Saccharopolyspora lacisalsi]|uniref:Uncharacterized protein n=1 Tax=Halosaccharopolyspora lacisalsi TaxID=1000566 RepID=A0A839DV17_9PSEU|nr:hypothetical protein [Halosaccharopolyspora lacisalsi]